MRVSELAKELGKSSKEVLDVLQKQGYGEKTHSSNVSDEQTQAVKKALAAPAKAEHAQGGAEAPKKKIAAVYRPQNAQTMKNPRPQAVFCFLIQRRRNPRKGQLLPLAAGRSLTTENVYRLKWR